MGLLQGKVAIVTGAGGGLGRAHALAFAREGALVVVNDPGVMRDGSGGGLPMADAVVEEIRGLGGQAVADYHTVATRQGADAIVRGAVEAFGRVDILVNNAGILRDRTLLKMADEEFDAVMQVHAYGTYYCTQAAAAKMREQGGGGRIVNTSSYAGLVGNFGQSNYGMAKAGIAGFTRVCALELGRDRITVNAIAPLAKTRMTEDISAVPAEITPEQISPFVVFLASELAANVTGRVFGTHGPHVFEYRMVLTDGVKKKSGLWEPAEFAAQLEAIAALPSDKAESAIAGAPSEAERVGALMQAIPATFRAGKAGSWESVIGFEVTGTGEWTLAVGGGQCTVKVGRAEAPKVRIGIDSAATLLEIAAGKASPESAFMSGRMKADNMGELMKFAQYFNLAKAAKLAAESAGGGAVGNDVPARAAAGPRELVAEIFANMGLAFLAEKAGSWQSTIGFEVGGAAEAGGGQWTVTVAEGQVSARAGAAEAPKVKIQFESAQTLLDMVSGKLAPEAAFMNGKMKADNIGELMRFGQYFDLKRGAAAAAQRGGPRSEVAEAPEGVNEKMVGTLIRGEAHFVRPEEFRAYALATDDTNPRYMSEGPEQVAPPLFVVRPVMKAVEKLVLDPALNADLLRLVHGEQDIRFLRPLRPWELVYPVAIFDRLERKDSGELIYCRQKLWSAGELVAEIVSTYFIRAARKGGGMANKPEVAETPAREWLFEESQTVGVDQPMRYGHASGDVNPIHMDDGVARAAGHPSVILHGLCTMAFCGRAVINGLLGGDSARLARLAGRFSKVVLPGDAIAVRGYALLSEGGVRRVGVEAVNQKGQVVFSHGVAELR